MVIKIIDINKIIHIKIVDIMSSGNLGLIVGLILHVYFIYNNLYFADEGGCVD